MSEFRRPSRAAAQKAEDIFGQIIKQEEETIQELQHVARSKDHEEQPSLIFTARFESQKGKEALQDLADVHPECARKVEPFVTLKFRSDTGKEKFGLLVDTQVARTKTDGPAGAKMAGGSAAFDSHSLDQYGFLGDDTQLTQDWLADYQSTIEPADSYNTVTSQLQDTVPSIFQTDASIRAALEIYRPAEARIHHPVETRVFAPLPSLQTTLQPVSTERITDQTNSLSTPHTLEEPRLLDQYRRYRASQPEFLGVSNSTFEAPQKIFDGRRTKKFSEDRVGALTPEPRLIDFFFSSGMASDKDSRELLGEPVDRSATSNLPERLKELTGNPQSMPSESQTIIYPSLHDDDAQLRLVDSMYVPARPLPEHLSYRVGPSADQRLMKYQECPNGWNGTKPTLYNNDYSDPRYWAAVSLKDQVAVWKALQPTLKDYTRHTGDTLTLANVPNLCDGYMAAYGWIHIQFQQWCFATKGHQHEWTKGGKVTHRLHKLDRWYGLLEDYYFAPNWPGRLRDGGGKIIQNPDCYSCEQCILYNIFCYGHREDRQARCRPCVAGERPCSKQLP